MEKRNKIIYYTATGLFSAMTLMAVMMYFFKTEDVRMMFESIGVSGALVIPLGIAKLLGLIAIWTNKSRLLKELAYLGYGMSFTGAIVAHLMAEDGLFYGPIILIILGGVSFIFHRKLFVN